MAAVLNNPPATKRWTFADLMQFDETERYEIYDGRLIPMAPARSKSLSSTAALPDKLYAQLLSDFIATATDLA